MIDIKSAAVASPPATGLILTCITMASTVPRDSGGRQNRSGAFMGHAAYANWKGAEGDGELEVGGAWVLPAARDLAGLVAVATAGRAPAGRFPVDASGLSALDTTGALLLVRALGLVEEPFDLERIRGMNPADIALLRLVAARQSHATTLRPRHSSLA